MLTPCNHNTRSELNGIRFDSLKAHVRCQLHPRIVTDLINAIEDTLWLDVWFRTKDPINTISERRIYADSMC